MHTFHHDDPPDDDQIQFVDLDSKTEPSPLSRFLSGVGKFLFASQARSIIFTWTFIGGLLILTLLLLPSIVTTTQPTIPPPTVVIPTVQPNLQYLQVDITSTQQLTFIHEGSSPWLIARRSSDGHETWKRAIFPSGTFYSCPQATETMIYCFSEEMSTPELIAVRPNDGATLWSRTTSDMGHWDFMAKGQTIYLANTKGIITAVNAQNNTTLWTWLSKSDRALQDRLVFGDQVVAILDDNGRVDVLNSTNGKLICQYQATSENWQPIIDHGIIYTSTQDDSIRAFNAQSGKLLWRYFSASLTPWSVTEANGIVYAHDNFTVIKALQGQTGHMLWQYQTPGMMTSPAIIQGNALYLATQNNVIVSLSATNGKPLWQKQLPSSVQLAEVPLDIIGDTIYTNLTLRNGIVYALQTSNGNERWQYQLSMAITSSPLLTPSTLYLPRDANHLEAKNASDGSERWLNTTPAGLIGDFQVSNGLLYVRQSNGMMEVIRGTDGTILWQFSLLSDA